MATRLRDRLALAVAISFIALQLGAIVYARFSASRYFCWAPFNAETKYRILVVLDGRSLTDQEIAARYRHRTFFFDPVSGEDWELNSIQHVLDLVRQYEETTGAKEGARVRIRYRINGGREQEWSWPPLHARID